MGARLSQPRGPGGTTEASIPVSAPPPPNPRSPFPRRINSRTIVAPAAALTMACLLYVYARTSIRAAKANAQRHRDADSGGEGLNLLNEHRRRHGLAERIEDRGGTVVQLGREITGLGRKEKSEVEKSKAGGAPEDETTKALRQQMGRRSGRSDG